MTIKYSVHNPITGIPSLHDTREQALEEFWRVIISYMYAHMGNTAYTKIEILENGTELHFNDREENIDQMLSLAEIENMIAQYKDYQN